MAIRPCLCVLALALALALAPASARGDAHLDLFAGGGLSLAAERVEPEGDQARAVGAVGVAALIGDDLFLAGGGALVELGRRPHSVRVGLLLGTTFLLAGRDAELLGEVGLDALHPDYLSGVDVRGGPQYLAYVGARATWALDCHHGLFLALALTPFSTHDTVDVLAEDGRRSEAWDLGGPTFLLGWRGRL